MKIVINDCFGGFSLSNFAYKEFLRRKGKQCYFYEWRFGSGYNRIDDDPDKHFNVMISTKDYGKHANEIDDECKFPFVKDRDNINFRTDSDFIAMIEEFGSEKCSGRYAELAIVDVPVGTYYRIEEYDGLEYIEYRDKINWQIAE